MESESGYLPLQQPGAGYSAPGAANYSAQQAPASPYGPAAGGGGSTKTPAKPRALPEVEFSFFVLSTIKAARISKLIANAMHLIQFIWRPRADKDDYDRTKRFEVKSKWSGSFKTIDNRKGEFSRIEFPRNGGAAKALKLVKDNFSNPNLDAVVPVFICNSAWYERMEPGLPRDGLMRGFTMVKSLPWFAGERAILLFASTAGPKVLAHELSHWCGFTHARFRGNADNIGSIGGAGWDIDRMQLRNYYRWATQIGFRKTLAGQ